jgi:hypothetical protein
MMERYSTTALYTNLKICLLYTYRERFENILCSNDNSDGCIDVANRCNRSNFDVYNFLCVGSTLS